MVHSSEAVEQIFSLFDKYGEGDYIGENVTQIEHAVQCAMMAEKEDGTTQVAIKHILSSPKETVFPVAVDD